MSEGSIVIRYDMEEQGQADALWRELNKWLRDTTAVQVRDTALFEGDILRTGYSALIKVEEHK